MISLSRFASDSTINEKGFQLTYHTQPCVGESCHSVCRDYSSGSGNLTSPYYPAPYTANTNCIYTISEPENMYIKMEVLTFDVPGQNDFIEMRDGHSEDSPLIGYFRGNETPPTIHSTQNYMWMR